MKRGGDFQPIVLLPNVGLQAFVATTYVQSGRPRDPALTMALRVR